MTLRNWKIATLVLALAFLSLLMYSVLQSKSGPSVAPDAVVTQIQKLSHLVTVRYRIERVVSMTEQKQPLGEESILLMVEGEVLGGIDLGGVKAADVVTDDTGTLTINLPSPAIFNASLDEKKTKVWDRHVTWWTPWVPPDQDLEHKARLKAVEDVRQAALEMGILEQARTNAQTALRDLFGALGWKVNIKIHGLD